MNNDLIRKLTFEEIQEKRPDFEKLKNRPRFPFVVLLDNIRSLHNVGAIFRTSDAVILEHIYLCGITGKPPRDEIRKTSLGAENSVPWSYEKNSLNVIEYLKKNKFQIVALEHTNKSQLIKNAHFKFPLCLIVGNEFLGIQDFLLSQCDIAVEIPMYGIKQSLNVSVAFGIAAYQLVDIYNNQFQKYD